MYYVEKFKTNILKNVLSIITYLVIMYIIAYVHQLKQKSNKSQKRYNNNSKYFPFKSSGINCLEMQSSIYSIKPNISIVTPLKKELNTWLLILLSSFGNLL